MTTPMPAEEARAECNGGFCPGVAFGGTVVALMSV